MGQPNWGTVVRLEEDYHAFNFLHQFKKEFMFHEPFGSEALDEPLNEESETQIGTRVLRNYTTKLSAYEKRIEKERVADA